MLNNDSYLAALSVAGELAEQGKVLAAKPNTPVHELVRFCSPGIDYKIENEDSVTGFGYFLENTTSNTIDENKSILSSNHSLELDGYVNDLSKLVTQHISLAKNVVKPLVVEYAEDLKNYLETHKAPSPSSKFEIIALKAPELLSDDSFLDSVNNYKQKSVLTPDNGKTLALENKSKEELISLCSTGRDRTDELVKLWLSRQSEEFLSDVWVSFFTKLTPVGKFYSYENINSLNAYEAADIALAIYLLSKKIYDDVQTSVDSLQVYQTKVAQLRDYAGALLVFNINKIGLFEKAKTLVIEFSPVTYKAKVNGALYSEWIKTGGSAEVILGMLVSNSNVSSLTLIDQKSKDYVNSWNSYVMFHEANESNKMFDYFKDYLMISLDRSLNDLQDVEKDLFAKNNSFISTIKKLADKEIEQLRTSDIEDVYDVALKIIAKARFYYTSSYSILSDINEAGKKNPNVDVREAALLAAINYMGDYLAYQITYVNG
jgi:hypothetical protein